MDTRKLAQEIAGRFEFRSGHALAKVTACLLIAWLGAYVPAHAGLDPDGRASLWILLLAAGLWVSEAIPAFATALLVIGLQILLLAAPLDHGTNWQIYTDPWASPPMWLFFGGLVLARSAERTGLAGWIAERALALTGGQGWRVLLVAAGVTMAFSMFISNTATAALMVAVLGVVTAAGRGASSEARATLLLSVAFAANLGGMGTIIGTPPNAIAAGLLSEIQPISFLEWMVLGVPPALLLAGGLIGTRMLRRMRGHSFSVDGILPASGTRHLAGPPEDADTVHLWQRIAVMSVFTATVSLWLTERWHGLPTAVISFLPIVALSTIGVMRREDMRALPWDILILLAGGLSLGVGVAESGLASWLAEKVAAMPAPAWVLALGLCYLTSALSNLMSNTAAANLVLPVAIALGVQLGGSLLAAQFAVPIALAASSAMCLPISTPPNAIIHATGEVNARDLFRGGLAVGLLAPPIVVGWCFPVLSWLQAAS